MYYERSSRAFNLLVGLALGTVVGVGLAFLVAPRRGGRRRHRLRGDRLGRRVSERSVVESRGKMGDRWDGLTVELRELIGPRRQRLWR